MSGRRHDGRGAAILILLHLVLKRGVDPGDTEAAVGAMQEAAHAAIFLLKPAGIVTVRITERAAVKIQGFLSFMADEARTSCHGSPLLCVQADDESTKARIRALRVAELARRVAGSQGRFPGGEGRRAVLAVVCLAAWRMKLHAADVAMKGRAGRRFP